MKASVVIPTMNGSRFLGPCLDALRQTRGVELETIVVDNGSTDDTPDLLRRHPEVKVLSFPEPLGFARANNAARKIATGEVVCFLNNDTQVEPGWAERPMQIFARDPDVAGVGSKLLYMHRFVPLRFSRKVAAEAGLLPEGLRDKVRRSETAIYVPLPVPRIDPPLAAAPVVRVVSDGPVTVNGRLLERFPAIVVVDRQAPTVRLIQNAGNYVTERCEGGDVGTGEEDAPGTYDREETVPAICGAALWARRSALDAIGWFPDYYTVYYEDVDLCLRLRSRGGKLVFCPSSRVNHYHTGTNREHSPKFVENVARSALLFTTRYGGPRTFARAVLDRIGYTSDELFHAGWQKAYGTRGFLSALAALPKPLAARVRDRVAGAEKPSTLVRESRHPYLEPR